MRITPKLNYTNERIKLSYTNFSIFYKKTAKKYGINEEIFRKLTAE